MFGDYQYYPQVRVVTNLNRVQMVGELPVWRIPCVDLLLPPYTLFRVNRVALLIGKKEEIRHLQFEVASRLCPLDVNIHLKVI